MTATNANNVMISKSITTVSANDLTTSVQADVDGNNVFERTATDVTVLNADGSRTTTSSVLNADAALIGKTTTTLSDTTVLNANGKPRRAFREQQRPRYLLSGLMKCGCCGANFTKYGANRFACAGSRDRGTCTNKLTIRGDELEASILAGLQTRLMEPARFEKFAADFVAETNKQRMSVSAAKAGKEVALGKVECQIKRLVDAIADGADAMPLNAKLKELDGQRTRLAGELEAAPQEKPLIHPAMAVAYRQRVAALAQALYDEEFGRQAFERLRAVVEAVVLTPVDGQLAIELRGEQAGILRIAKKKQTIYFTKKNAL